MSNYFFVEFSEHNVKTGTGDVVKVLKVDTMSELEDIKAKLQITEDIKDSDFFEVFYLDDEYNYFDFQATTYDLVNQSGLFAWHFTPGKGVMF